VSDIAGATGSAGAAATWSGSFGGRAAPAWGRLHLHERCGREGTLVTEPRAKMQTDRMKGLTDGVLAIVLTLPVLYFEVPDHDFGSERLDAFFRSLVEPFVAYLVSFGIISASWIQHAAIHHDVRIADRTFVWLSLLFLLPVTLLPFLTDLGATYHDQHIVTVLCAPGNVTACLALLAMWIYAQRRA
jgi:uncharacterized membrane protein